MPQEQKVQCTRCRNKHLYSERARAPSATISGVLDLVCPRCNCRSYYQLDADGKRTA
ncbi:hypothetical protein [Pseudomonas chlororaphis]|uniref:hypothetical protein n=1 Tax=Pseudomonas chlororaphis TaxID=587753 RepID=UPI0039E09EF1